MQEGRALSPALALVPPDCPTLLSPRAGAGVSTQTAPPWIAHRHQPEISQKAQEQSLLEGSVSPSPEAWRFAQPGAIQGCPAGPAGGALLAREGAQHSPALAAQLGNSSSWLLTLLS